MPIIPDSLPQKDEYQLLKEEHRRIQDELTQARATIENYDRELKRRNEEMYQASRYIDYLQNKLDAKTFSDASGPQVFSTKADTISISEVGEKVTALNEGIFQAAATLGDTLIQKCRNVSQTDLDAAAAMSQKLVGKKMTNLLITQSRNPEPEVNPLLVQVVLQIFMVKFCVSKMESWYPNDSAVGEILAAIYSEIRSTEGQAASGRWRALTLAKTRPSTETWKKELHQKLQSVLMIASWTTLSSDHEDSYGNCLSSIFKAIYELRMAIGENFTSADLDIFGFECDTIYDPAVMMDDAYHGDGSQSSGNKRAPEAIVGTTGIGLEEVIAKRGAKDILQLQIIIPAKIVLWSTLNEALEPIIQSAKLKRKKLVENMDGANQDGRD